VSTQTLAQKFDALAEAGILDIDLPQAVTDNLRSALRPYQVDALQRFLYYVGDYRQRQHPAHLLFHMATGSGKTVLMAALILDLYTRGYRDFLFFVDKTQIVEKTKANFLDPAASKYLFADDIRINGLPITVREVSNFGESDPAAINIRFTTLGTLHSEMNRPRENGVTIEDFQDRGDRGGVVLIADEAHHLNAETKRDARQLELEVDSWENTVTRIFRADRRNMMLDFTATQDFGHPAIAAKYIDKLLVDYSLRQFRADRYSKEIELRRADIPPEERILQAIVLSQYRRKLAGEHRLFLKPVVLFKSKTIAESAEAEESFSALVESLDAWALERLRDRYGTGDLVGEALTHVIGPPGTAGLMSASDFAAELRLDFDPSKVRNVNKPDDLERLQIELNTLEDRDNEVRAIFAVDKLNEGWDVLNLFDIVRLYDTGTNKTTNQEAQLIGRGARYWPFVAPERPDDPRDQRKYDGVDDAPLRVIETLHYHCSHNPTYFAQIKEALVSSGMMDEDTRKATVRVKDAFKATELYQSGVLFANERRANERDGILALKDYKVPELVKVSIGYSGRTTASDAFGAETVTTASGAKIRTDKKRFADLGVPVVRHALDSDRFYHFGNLKHHFPRLKSMREFMDDAAFVGGITIELSGPSGLLDGLTPAEKLEVAEGALGEVREAIEANSHSETGTRMFKPHGVRATIKDATLTVGGPYRQRWADWPDNDGLDLRDADWFAHHDFYGTTGELELIRYFARRIDELKDAYGDVQLVRNEKAIKLYNFPDGAGFEPDFLLFLDHDDQGEAIVVQLFIEPKGKHLAKGEEWKNDFLESIEAQYELPDAYAKTHKLRGLPFFDEQSLATAQRFREAQAKYR
jgi:type III restriction enzyme